MSEYTKIETARSIICDMCKCLYSDGYCPEKCDLEKCDWMEYLKEDAADVVPVSELLTLRDALYENDQITMRGLARLNMLIAKYGGYDHG